MKSAISVQPSKPIQNRIFFYFGLLMAQYCLIGRIRPLGWISAKVMVNRIVVNIMDKPKEVELIINPFSLEVINKQGSPALIHFIISLGITVKIIAKLLHSKLWIRKVDLSQFFVGVQCLGVSKKNIFTTHSDENVKMVGQQTVSIGLADRVDVLGIFFQEIAVVVIAVEEVIAANSMVVEMVIVVGM